MRPDLFDPHTIHFHGFPNAASVFDGEPMASIGVTQNNSLTYFYDLQRAGDLHVPLPPGGRPSTCRWACWATSTSCPRRTTSPTARSWATFTHHTGYKYVYNDGDGSTYYDVEIPIQMSGFDPVFHAADLGIQPPPFATMVDVYPMLNGRGYPDTVNPAGIMNNRSSLLGQRREQGGPENPRPHHVHARPEGPPAHLEPGHDGVQHPDRPGSPHEGRGHGGPPPARVPTTPDGTPGKNMYYLHADHQPGRRRGERRHRRHEQRPRGDLLPLQHEPEEPATTTSRTTAA